MSASPPPPLTDWLNAHVASHERLTGIVQKLTPQEIAGPSYDTEWSIAQVLSHLGSGAEIFTLFLEAGLTGAPSPGMPEFEPIWETWNAKAPEDQASDALVMEQSFVDRLASLTDAERENWRFEMFGGEQDMTGLLRFRVGEHALHTWDVEVMGNADAGIAPTAVDLLIDHIGQLASMSGKAPEGGLHQPVATESPERHFVVVASDGAVELQTWEKNGDQTALSLPAESFIRLIYGRLDPEHTPSVSGASEELDVLRQTFPGF